VTVDRVPADARSHIEDLAAFVTASPSSYHAAAEAVRRATAAGYALLDEREAWDVAPGGRYVVRRDGSVIAFALPEAAAATTPFVIVGAHTDSPGFKLKPKPTTHGPGGWWQLGLEVYGGPLLNSWLDRELELAGRIVTRDGAEHLVRTGSLLRIPQLAVHLDRSVTSEGLTLDKQRHTQPVWGLGDEESADVLQALAARAGLDAAEIGGYDIVVADTQEPRTFGHAQELFASGRLDNLLSAHAALVAQLDTAPSDAITMYAAFDHEEIGSASATGAEREPGARTASVTPPRTSSSTRTRASAVDGFTPAPPAAGPATGHRSPGRRGPAAAGRAPGGRRAGRRPRAAAGCW